MTNSSATTERAATPQAPVYTAMRWAVLAASCMTVLGFQTAALSCSPLLGEMARSVNVPLSQSVALMAVFMLFAALSYAPAGALFGKLGVAKSLVASAIFSGLGSTLVLALGHSFGALVLMRALQGCSVGFSMAAMAPLVMQWFPPEQRGIALGIPGACNPLGAMLAVLISPVLFRATGSWQQALAWMSLFGWAALLYCLVIFRIAAPHVPGMSGLSQEGGAGKSLFAAALRSPYTWVGVAGTFAVNWLLQSAFSISPSYFAEAKPLGLGMGPVLGGQMMGIVQVGAVIGPIVGGLLLDKIFSGRSRVVLALGFVLSLVYCAIQSPAICSAKGAFIPALLLSGAGIGMLFPMVQSRISEVYDASIVGQMNGLWLGLGAFGGSIGIFATSVALKNTNSYALPITIISAAAVVGLVFCSVPAKAAR